MAKLMNFKKFFARWAAPFANQLLEKEKAASHTRR